MAISVQQQNDFINQITPIILKYAPQYNIVCPGIVLVQAIKESGYGTSNKAQHHNYFGLKFRPNRCPSASGTFVDGGSEQNPDGSYRPISTQWFEFPNMDAGVKGYFDFTNITNYKELKNETDGLTYLQKLQKAKYFTSQTYVDSAYKLYKERKLDEFDRKYQEKLGITSKPAATVASGNSPLITYSNISKKKTSPRNHKIDTITIHCYVGQVTAKQGCDMFANTTRDASCNYVVGKDGSIGLCVDEKDRSWCSSNAANDHRAITIEVASDSTDPYAVTEQAMESLIKLCADICKRNGIKQLVWSEDKNTRVNHLNGANMTVHRDYAAKACPGAYLYSKHGYIAQQVNALLGVKTPENIEEKTPEIMQTGKTSYTVVKGDTLNKIAIKYNTTVEDIVKQNGIKNPNLIKPGQKLEINMGNIEIMTVKTNGSNLRIRQNPTDVNSPIIGTIPNGAKVKVINKLNPSWYYIDYNGKQGYSCTAYLK